MLANNCQKDRCKVLHEPVIDHVLNGSVGSNGSNLRGDVLSVQQMLNSLTFVEGGPQPPLAEDGISGPKTIAAIEKFQRFALGQSDGRIDARGPTIKALIKQILSSPLVPFGPLGLNGRSNAVASLSIAASAISEAQKCFVELEPRLNILGWKLAHRFPPVTALLDKHFSHLKQRVTDSDIAHVRAILGSTLRYVARFNSFGKLPIENVLLFSAAEPGGVIAWTVRGGDKMSTEQIQIYYDEDIKTYTKNPGQSIWFTRIFADLPYCQKQWTVLHEMMHFLGPRDDVWGEINDYAYAGDNKFLSLSKFTRLHNAESLSLFFLEYCIGTEDTVSCPRLSLHRNHFARFPRVTSSGEIVSA